MNDHLFDENETLKKLFSIFSNDDSFKIFLRAKNGLDASSLSYLKLGIPSKTYYSKLKKLIDLNLIEKIEGMYSYTTFGNAIYNQFLLSLDDHVRKLDQYRIVDTLKHSNKFSENEINRFLMNIVEQSRVSQFSFQKPSTIKSHYDKDIKIFLSYEEMVPEIQKEIERSAIEILIATRIFDDKLFNAVFHKAKSGVKVKVLCDEGLINKYYQSYGRIETNKDKHTTERINLIGNPWYQDKDIVERRITSIPFGLIIFDHKITGIELINQYETGSLGSGIFIKDENTAITMTNYYNKIWNLSSNAKYDYPI
ncbi:MAG: hypothetical protein M3162_01100 [Thermoproteota archaeon]|nr:hypothetical protein [Thermoproteota archaeon]